MKVMISAGESSGDIHAAKVVDALIKEHARSQPEQTFECFGMGGQRLQASGMEVLVDVEHNAVMGLLEVLHKYPSLRANLTTLKNALSTRKPDILILVDYPHFNMKLAESAKALGIPVLFYIAPKVWASRPGRIKELKKNVDHIALILPFETKIFEEEKIDCTYVGNPLLDSPELTDAAIQNKSASNAQLAIQQSTTQIALLPGSRKSEINMLLPAMVKTAAKIKASYPDAKFVLPVADTIDQSTVESITNDAGVTVQYLQPTDYETLARSNVALVTSGTATLELALLNVPMVVVYRLKPLSYAVLKRWLTIKHISLVNIIADETVVPELLQDDVTTENLFEQIDTLLSDESANNEQLQGLQQVSDQLGGAGASERTAQIAIQMAHADNSSSSDNPVEAS